MGKKFTLHFSSIEYDFGFDKTLGFLLRLPIILKTSASPLRNNGISSLKKGTLANKRGFPFVVAVITNFREVYRCSGKKECHNYIFPTVSIC